VRIGIFGNTNNYPLLLAVGLRRLGHPTVLVVNRKEQLHRPESKYPELAAGYPSWILDCSDIPEDEFVEATSRIGPVLDFLAGAADALILNDLGPSLAEFCRQPAVALMTGSDLTYYADPQTRTLRQEGWAPAFTASPSGRLWTRRFDEFVQRQRDGIRNAAAVSAPLRGLVPAIDALLDDIGVADSRRDFVYLADTDVPPVPPTRSNPRLRVVNGARLNWKAPLPPGFSSQDQKGTDILLEGFSRFVARGGDAELLLFRKGLHVAETESLVQALGVASRIVWRDEVTLRAFHQEIAQADVLCDQVGESFPGLAALDAMAMAVPVIANFRPEATAAHFTEPIAACQARTATEVASHLTTLAGSAEIRIKAGRAARRFARLHLSPEANARRCLRHFGVH
jgi:glycosyltransferase involved in cell wall biosynthesis